MSKIKKTSLLSSIGSDFPSSIVVFLVALPLCLGVAVASDAMPITGVIAGIIGGIVVGAMSGSSLSVSGPAAGLTAIVAGALGKLPTYETFLISVFLAGLFQLLFGYLRAGVIGRYIPNAVIKGMLAAIGLILILKQIPHFIGYDKDPFGEESFFQHDGENTFSTLYLALNKISPVAILIGLISSAILLFYESKKIKSMKFFQLVPGPLIVVVTGILLNEYLLPDAHLLSLREEHLVQLPVFDTAGELFGALPRPDWGNIFIPQVWITAVTLAIVASLESLLSLEAIDKIDPARNISPPNRELKAQGVGNMISGLLGGLPITSVIVRSSANVNSGGKSKLSTILHGGMLLVSLLVFPELLNKIPIAALAAILIFTGYKLAKVSLFVEYFKKGMDQFLPFVITISAILFTDLLIGIIIGISVGLFFVLRSNFKTSVFILKEDQKYLIRFRKEVSFLNKPLLIGYFEKIPPGSAVLIDATKSEFIDKDVIEIVNDFIESSESKDIRIYIKREFGNTKEIFIDPMKRVTE